MKTYCLEVSGDFACFTRPEMKVERVSYDVITPSAARAMFEAILWKPAIRWHLRRIEVLKPIRWISLRRNEVASVVSTRNVETTMKTGTGDLALYIEEDRQQRAGLFLRDVATGSMPIWSSLPGVIHNSTPPSTTRCSSGVRARGSASTSLPGVPGVRCRFSLDEER